MKTLDRRRFLLAASAAVAACDQVVVDVSGLPDNVELDADGKPFISPISEIGQFYVYQVGGFPDVEERTWSCVILDRGTELGRIDKALLETLTPREVELTLQCIGSTPSIRNINNAVWGGLPLAEVLEAAGVQGPGESIIELRLAGADDYHASLPVEDVEGAPVWVIWRMNGQPLPFEHGAPCRLMVPGRYGIKNLKWITEIEYLDTVHEGFWDPMGWSHTGEYKTNGFIFFPATNTSVLAPVWVVGTAFSGRDPVARVELTDDGGETWTECTITYGAEENVWALWELLWTPTDPGTYDVQVRVTTASGSQSVMEPGGTDRLQGYDGGMLVKLTVA